MTRSVTRRGALPARRRWVPAPALSRSFALALALVLLAAAGPTAPGRATEAGPRATAVAPDRVEPPPDLPARALVLVDAAGAVLSEGRGEAAVAPASLNKLMTLKLVYEALAAGELRWDEPVTTPAAATGVGGSRLGLRPGDVRTVEELVRASAVGSANDASRVLAIRLAGSLEAFVERMNARAVELGLERTVFRNPDGWDAPGQTTTALDMARLAVIYLREHPEALADHAAPSVTVGGVTLSNPNGLVARGAGVDGLKTGYTAQAGFNLVATAERDGLRLIAVVLGSPSESARERAALALLDHGFEHYAAVEVPAGTPAGSWPVRAGRKAEVAAVTAEPWRATVRRDVLAAGGGPALAGAPVRVVPVAGEEAGAAPAGAPRALDAPVRAGAPLGLAAVMAGEVSLGAVGVEAAEDVRRASIWQRFLEWLSRLVRRG